MGFLSHIFSLLTGTKVIIYYEEEDYFLSFSRIISLQTFVIRNKYSKAIAPFRN